MRNFLVLLLFPALLFSQKKAEVFKKTAEFACECANQKEDVSEMSLGLCLLEALNKISPKEQKLIGYNSLKKKETIEKVASDLGMEMAAVCPTIFSKFVEQNNEGIDETENGDSNSDVIYLKFTGVLKEVKTGQFNIITLVNEAKKEMEFVWLFPFDGDNLFIKNKIIKGDTIEIEYREQSFYDPAKKDYRLYNEITEVTFID